MLFRSLDVLFLPEAGNGVLGRLRQLRVVPQGFLIRKLGVGGDGLSLGLGCGPVGFELVPVDTAADHAARLPFRQFLPLVAALHAHIFVFYLMDFSVEVKPGFLYGAAGRVWFDLALSDLFDAARQEALIGLIRNKLYEQFGVTGDEGLVAQGFFPEYISTTENFEVTEDGITFYYNPYDIGCYALGGVEVHITREEMQGL